MLEMARTKLLNCLLTEVIDGKWHCGKPQYHSTHHQAEWLQEFTRRVGNLGQKSISDTLLALKPEKEALVKGGWSTLSGLNEVLHSISLKCIALHRVEGGLCLRCANSAQLQLHKEHTK